ncbi:DUF368 domain-containing protein [Clostridium bornimense]|uniref:DUF368 domain-containing protein n=1 Tax=Clostridium bornimense TaxID=1216932 RepID=UPI001C10367D|nr:DUF368 domain-containing protein [Clostridium bornimense]MBU5315962.1 DUF368 domain-containing protein [Clostridium bornimense]
MFIINFIRGFFMALADSVPGVSGGTIAFLLGFYDNFINSLNALVSRKSSKEEKKTSIIFLLKLGIGWVTGFLLSMIILSSIFEKEIYKISSVFIGFIVLAIPIVIKEEKESIKGKYTNIIFTIIGIVIVAAITYFNPAGGNGFNLSLDSISIGLGLYVFFVGMIAISAMVLPGISGSTLLLIFGLYVPIVNAIKETLKLNLSYLPILFIFGFGVIFGIVSVIRLLKYLLENYRSQVIYLILGLMIGSLYAVFMGPTTLETPKDPMTFKTFSIIYFIIGGAVIFALQQLKVFFEKR